MDDSEPPACEQCGRRTRPIHGRCPNCGHVDPAFLPEPKTEPLTRRGALSDLVELLPYIFPGLAAVVVLALVAPGVLAILAALALVAFVLWSLAGGSL